MTDLTTLIELALYAALAAFGVVSAIYLAGLVIFLIWFAATAVFWITVDFAQRLTRQGRWQR